MSVTVSHVVRRALLNLMAIGGEAPITNTEYGDSIDALNDLMTELESPRVRLGFTEVENLADVMTVPRGTINGIIHMLAYELAPMYSVPPDKIPVLRDLADQHRGSVRGSNFRFKPQSFPPTMPRGSGQPSNLYDDEKYYQTDIDPAPICVLGVDQNAGETTISVASTAVAIDAVFESLVSILFETTPDGLATYKYDTKKKLPITAGVFMAPATESAQTLTASLSVNGTIDTSTTVSQVVSVGQPVVFSIRDFWREFSYNDYVQLYVTNETSTDNIVVSSCNLVIGR